MSDWHLNKSVNVSIIIGMAVYAGSFLWFMSTMDSRVAQLELNDVENGIVNKSFYGLEATMGSMQAGQVRIESQLDKMDGRINRILEKD